jgi:fatty-acyl-CoA synthase
MTEASPGITMTPRDATIAKRSQTVGMALPEMEVKIVDPGAVRSVRQASAVNSACVATT